MSVNPYNNSIIYMIVCNITNDVYIGSTTKSIDERMGFHKINFKAFQNGAKQSYCRSFDILKTNDYKVYIIENVNCNSKRELEKIEGYYIKNNNCINKQIAGRTDAEYYLDNKELINEKKNVKCKCECTGRYLITHKAIHSRTKKHQKYINAHLDDILQNESA